MEKQNRIGRTWNITAGTAYLIVSLVSWFVMPMALKVAIDATNPLYICLIDICEIVFFIIPLLCIAAIVANVILRKKELRVASFVVKILPLVIFGLNMLLFGLAGLLPKTN